MFQKARRLREFLVSKRIVKIAGAHNSLGAKLIEKHGFDGVWASGLEISASHAVPDANILTMSENLNAAREMNESTDLPVICDCDTGYGNTLNVTHLVKKYEASGLAAIVIEDKLFPKTNSFVAGRQDLIPMEEFMGKIEAAKNAQRSPDFMVFARSEALIAGWGLEEALRRAHAYAEAGADGIVIHSKAATPDEVFGFSRKWKGAIPLVAIPTTYYTVTADELAGHGFKMVIYANHGIRAAIRAMDRSFQSIAETGSSASIEPSIASLKEVFDLQGMDRMKDIEKKFSRKERIQAVIPAAGDHRSQPELQNLLSEKPLCMLEIGGKTLVERQADALRSCGIEDIVVVGGPSSEKIRLDKAEILRNPRYRESGNAYSLMLTKDRWKTKCVMVYSDILFDRHILERLLTSPHPITLVIDRAYKTLPPRQKRLDLVAVEEISNGSHRRLEADVFRRMRKIGQTLKGDSARFEFIGMAFFQEEGLLKLKQGWEKALTEYKDKPFYEAPCAEKADLADLIQCVIDSGAPVHGMEIEHGWSEIHSLDDYERVKAHFEARSAAYSETP